MAYTITTTNGTTLGTIPDGQVNGPNTAGGFTSLTLVGRNYPNYGQIIADDLVALLENFSDTTAPVNQIKGQLWWNSSANILSVNKDGTTNGWKTVGGATYSSSAPSSPTPGDLWYNSSSNQFYAYSGSTWVLIGPSYNSNNGASGAIWETISDGTNNHDVVSLYLDGIRTAIISKDSTFTPSPSISGFTSLQPGYNMSSTYTIWGTANVASYIGTQPAANVWYNNQNNTGTGTLSVVNNTGISVGTNGALTLSVSGNIAQLINSVTGGNLSMYVNSSQYGSQRGFNISGVTGHVYVNADPIYSLGVATKQYVDNSFINTALTGVPTAPTMPGGTANTAIATTAFVINNSGFFTNKIYQGNSGFEIDDTGAGTATLTIDNTAILTASVSGVNLLNGATAITQPDTYNGTGNAAVATTQFVKNSTQWWGGSAKFVSNVAPNPGVNDIGSNNGDFWFQYTT